MKSRRPPGEAPPDTGPFRKMERIVDTGEDATLQRMEQEIAAEGKFSIQLPEDIKLGNAVPFFADALKNPDIGPAGVVFYSLATGIVKYDHVIVRIAGQTKSYVYKSKADSHIKLMIGVEKNKAAFESVTTKEDAKKIKSAKEKSDWHLATYELKDNIEKIKKIIKDGTLNPELDDLKKNTESLLQTINDEQKKKK